MSTQMNLEELKALIANGIKEQNLHEALPEDAVERIKEKILAMRDKEHAQEIPDIVSELNFPPRGETTEMPDENDLMASPEQQIDMTGSTQPEIFVDAGAVATETPLEPVVGYTPELPEVLKKAEPAELFVFQYNDIGESGENLSYKPMRLMDDPDVKKSMQDLWVQEGKTRAKVYVAKFEEIGEIEFNYANGTSRFNEKSATPDYVGGTEYKENPYMTPSMPQIDATTQKELETYIKNSMDLEKVVHDIVMGIVKDSILTNTEKVAVSEDIAPVEDRFGNATKNAQDLKPMEEVFNLSMKEIAEGDAYEKITLPEYLNESIKSGDKSMLLRQNNSMQEWVFEGKSYFTPIDRLSKTKGYIKL